MALQFVNMLPASLFQRRQYRIQVIGEVLSRGAMLFTSMLLPAFGPMLGKDSAWNHYIG